MPSARIPGPIGTNPLMSQAEKTTKCGFGYMASSGPIGLANTIRVNSELIPGVHRSVEETDTTTGTAIRSLPTDQRLIQLANELQIDPAGRNVVFYHGASGAAKAKEFVTQHPKFVRLDDLLQQTELGRVFLDDLLKLSKEDFKKAEEIWWTISARLAESAKGDVHVFGGDVYANGHDRSNANVTGEDPQDFRSRFDKKRYMDTTFDKVELPILTTNQSVGKIYYNGEVTDW